MAVILNTRATIAGTGFSTPGITQLWWSPQTAGGSTADATDCLARFRAFWFALVARIYAGTTFTFDPTCIAVEATTGVLTGAFAGTTPAVVTGTEAGDPLPRQTQGLLRMGTSTVISGRRVRGRLFIPSPGEGQNTSGSGPIAAYMTDVTTAGGGLLVAGATTSMPVIWHRPGPGGAGASPLVTSMAASGEWSVLRSRRA
jgi:hypothetical protein